jgi:hypothetical protein
MKRRHFLTQSLVIASLLLEQVGEQFLCSVKLPVRLLPSRLTASVDSVN